MSLSLTKKNKSLLLSFNNLNDIFDSEKYPIYKERINFWDDFSYMRKYYDSNFMKDKRFFLRMNFKNKYWKY